MYRQFKTCGFLAVLMFVFVGSNLAISEALNYVPISWGDNVYVFGAGTDAAFDSNEAIANMMNRIKGRGFTGVLFRADVSHIDQNDIIWNYDGMSAGTRAQQRAMYETGELFDVITTARQAAENEGLEFWCWYPNVYGDGAPPDFPDCTFAWPYEGQYVHDNPEVITVDRAGTKQYSVMEYAYAGARAEKVSQFTYLAQQCGVKKFVACMRSEASQMQDAPDYADQFGFSPIIVEEMNDIYDVDILTDSRFDCYDPNFAPCDAMVQNWHNLRGSYLTQFYTDLRNGLDAIDPNIKVMVQIPGGDYVGPPLGNYKLDWRKWIDDGLVDSIVHNVTLEASVDPYSNTKDYLTNAIKGIGILPSSTFRVFIDDSNNPDLKLIQAGGSYLYRVEASDNFDGWRTDMTYDMYEYAWYQRWKQWENDVNEYGYVKFFDQNFDGFLDSNSYSGGQGDGRYNPDIQACPGLWYTLGDGTDNKPVVQSVIKHGGTGKSLKFTRDSNSTGQEACYARHYSSIDTGKTLKSPDPPIFNGTCTLEYWYYKTDSNSSGVIGFMSDESIQYGVGLYVPSNGYIYYRNSPSWSNSGYQILNQQWTKFTIEVNLESETYSAYIGENKETSICINIDYSALASYNRFNQLIISPQAPPVNKVATIYIDDVSVKWYPNLVFEKQYAGIYLKDDFESHTVDANMHLLNPDIGAAWKVLPVASANNLTIENDISFGNGYKCLKAKRPITGTTLLYSGDSSKLSLDINRKVTVDFDVYVPTGASFIVGLYESIAGPYTANIFATLTGKWYYHNGTGYVDSGVNINTNNWTHCQMVLDCASRSYDVIVQPAGCTPTYIGTGVWDPGTLTGDSVHLLISEQTGGTDTSYIDNIEITYGEPDLTPFSYLRPNIYLRDNFEAHTAGQTIHNANPEQGNTWLVYTASEANDQLINSNHSCGIGTKSLAALRDATPSGVYSGYSSKLTLDPNYIITVDYDIYVPTGASTVLSMAETYTSGPFPAGLFANNTNGKWYYINNGAYVNSNVGIDCNTWTHCQMTLYCKPELCKYVIKSQNGSAVVLGTGTWGSGTVAGDSVFPYISPQSPTNGTTYYDNILITYGDMGSNWYYFEFSEEDLWDHTTSANSRLYNQLAPRRHHTAWKTDVQTTDSTQPNQSLYQTTSGTNGWYQTATYDSWLGSGPLDNYSNNFGICQFNLWGAGWPNGRLVFNERYRVNEGADAWIIVSTPDGWTGNIVDNSNDDNNTGGLDQYYIEWSVNDYNNRILYDSYGDEVNDNVFRFAVNIVGEYDTTLEPDPNDDPFESDGTLRVWFGGNVLDPNDEFTDEGFDGIMTLTPDE